MIDPLALFTTLGTLVLERTSAGTFRRLGASPEWCRELWANGAAGELTVEDALPFLDAFLPDAEGAWRSTGLPPVESDIWTEITRAGTELHLQATALRVEESELLLVARGDALHDSQQQLLQRARALRSTHDALAREVEQKDVLVHCIIHDLQGPLNTILGTLSLFGEQTLPPDVTHLAATAERAALRQRDLIRDILQVFAVEHETATPASALPMATADANEAIREAIVLLEPAARTRRIAVTVDLGRAASDGPVRVLGDRSRLLRVVSNLLENALRHARELVAVSLSQHGSFTRLTVEDDGAGVPAEVAAHLFEKFARTTGPRGGTGLGLYFCRITVERWGGAIGYEPRAEGGARFWVQLPRGPEPPPPRLTDVNT